MGEELQTVRGCLPLALRGDGGEVTVAEAGECSPFAALGRFTMHAGATTLGLRFALGGGRFTLGGERLNLGAGRLALGGGIFSQG